MTDLLCSILWVRTERRTEKWCCVWVNALCLCLYVYLFQLSCCIVRLLLFLVVLPSYTFLVAFSVRINKFAHRDIVEWWAEFKGWEISWWRGKNKENMEKKISEKNVIESAKMYLQFVFILSLHHEWMVGVEGLLQHKYNSYYSTKLNSRSEKINYRTISRISYFLFILWLVSTLSFFPSSYILSRNYNLSGVVSLWWS